MHPFLDLLKKYFRAVNGAVFACVTALTAACILLNYTVGIESRIVSLPTSFEKASAFFLLFAFVFNAAWLLQRLFSKDPLFISPFFCIMLLIAPLIFALKITFDWFPEWLTRYLAWPWNAYWSITLNWPLKGLLVFGLVALCWRWGKWPLPMAGLSWKGFSPKPYLLLLLCMIPLLALAATQESFQNTYPKWARVGFIDPFVEEPLPPKLLFELAYGLDFFTIELFFRGFLVLAFVRYAGMASILPMAAFYCSIHFGKPVLECITSYFGGIILGVIVYHTRSIWGGLIIHLGIAWLMEVAGAIARWSCSQQA